MRSGPISSTFSRNASLNSCRDEKSFGEMHTAGIPCFFARSRAYAFALLLITAVILAFLICPLSILSIMACRLVPPPDTMTTTFSIARLPFLHPRYGPPHRACPLPGGLLPSPHPHL